MASEHPRLRWKQDITGEWDLLLDGEAIGGVMFNDDEMLQGEGWCTIYACGDFRDRIGLVALPNWEEAKNRLFDQVIELLRERDAPDLVRVNKVCYVTGKKHSLLVTRDGLAALERGANIAEAFPDMPAEQRAFLISGLSPEGWSQLFGPPNDA